MTNPIYLLGAIWVECIKEVRLINGLISFTLANTCVTHLQWKCVRNASADCVHPCQNDSLPFTNCS